MNTYKPGELYLVEFDPSVGNEIQKTRPALVLGDPRHIKKMHLIPIIPLSSRVATGKQFEIPLKKNNENKLFCDSIILANQLYTYDKKRFIKKIGHISYEEYISTLQCVGEMLGIY